MPAERYQDGDRVTDGKGNIGYVRRCVSKRNREQFLRVFIAEGPRKGQWDACYRFRVSIDYPNGTVSDICPDCMREFKRPLLKNTVFCVECQRQKDAEDDRIAASEPVSQAHQRNILRGRR